MSVKVTPYRQVNRPVLNNKAEDQLLFSYMIEGLNSWAVLPSHQKILDEYRAKIRYECNPETMPLNHVLADFAYQVSGRIFPDNIIEHKDNANLLIEFITTGEISKKRTTRGKHSFYHYCAKCGKYTKLQTDHVFPISSFGDRYHDGGVQGLCEDCNRMKSNKIDYYSIAHFVNKNM